MLTAKAAIINSKLTALNVELAHLENWNMIDFDDRRQVTDIILPQVQATSDRVSFEWKI